MTKILNDVIIFEVDVHDEVGTLLHVLEVDVGTELLWDHWLGKRVCVDGVEAAVGWALLYLPLTILGF